MTYQSVTFFDNPLRDTEASELSVRLQIGRAFWGSTEFFMLGGGHQRVLLDGDCAADFMDAMLKLRTCLQRGKLADKEFFNAALSDSDGGHLGIDFGLKCGRPYIGIESARVDISYEDVCYIYAAANSVRYLARRRLRPGPAMKVARTPSGPQLGLGTARSLDPAPYGQAWYDD